MGVLGSEGPRVSVAPENSPSDVLGHLESVLKSPPFCSSQRSCQFLRHVVETTLAGESEQLKERLIGERIFGRRVDYDTGQDSIVRVKANEVRRRLAQYYDLHPESLLRIELPPGSYVPQIHRTAGHTVQEDLPVLMQPVLLSSSPVVPWWKNRRAALVALFVTALAAAAAWLALRSVMPADSFTAFWAPFFMGQHEIILCVPTPETYRIYGDGNAAFAEAFRPRPPGVALKLPDRSVFERVQVVPESGLSLGLGDAHAMTLLYSFAAARGKTPLIRLGNDTTFTDLRAGPNVLIGGFTNRWSLDLMGDARFTFGTQGSTYGIIDKTTGKFVCRKADPWQPRLKEDCAVVTRVPNSKTGHPLLVGAGLDHFGTYAVGEFLTKPKLIEAALQHVPAGWADKNMQIVLGIEVVRDNIGSQRVLAVNVW